MTHFVASWLKIIQKRPGGWVFWLVAGYFQEQKRGVAVGVIATGKMQIANTRDTVPEERCTDYEA